MLWSEECLEREVKKGDDTQTQYYVYVLEANLSFHSGMTIPLMSEFLSYAKGDTDTRKQDCELKAFWTGYIPTDRSWNCAAKTAGIS